MQAMKRRETVERAIVEKETVERTTVERETVERATAERAIGRRKTVEKETEGRATGKPLQIKTMYPAPDRYPIRGEHPRVLFTREQTAVLRERLTAEENQEEYRIYKAYRDDMSYGGTGAGGKGTDFPDEVIEAKAYAYVVEGDTRKGREAVWLLEKSLMEIPFVDPATFQISDNYTRGYGVHLRVAAEVYDWCHDLLTDLDKETICVACEDRLAPYMEIGFPPGRPSSITSHSSEAQLLENWLSFSIAVYDEYPDLYEYVGGRFFAEYVPFRNDYYRSDFVHQGSAYGIERFQYDLYSALLMKAMTGGHMVYNAHMGNIVRSYAYMIRADGQLLRMGDDYNAKRAPYGMGELGEAALVSAALTGNGVDKWLAQRYDKNRDPGRHISAVHHLILNDPSIQPVPVDTLPLVRYNGSPVGQMFARTGWDVGNAGSQDILVYMKVGETYVGNHDHLNAGDFQIYYKGILALDSGGYGVYGPGTHADAYSKRTIAHNTILVSRDGDIEDDNCGGQRYLGEVASSGQWTKERQTGSVLGHASQTEGGKLQYAYLAGDITSAYDMSLVQELCRYMLFVPGGEDDIPGFFFVFDKVTATREDCRKTFLLHMQEEPCILGNQITITRTERSYNGKLVSQTLLPKAARIEGIGGKGREFMVNGHNWDYPGWDSLPEESDIELGWGRAEITAGGNLTDYFLHAMCIQDADRENQVPQTECLETGTYGGCRIGKYVAVFPKGRDRVATAFEVETAATGEELVWYVAGVAAGEWEIRADTAYMGKAMADQEGGILRFKAGAGKIRLVPQNLSAGLKEETDRYPGEHADFSPGADREE